MSKAKQEKILIVDDDAGIRKQLRWALDEFSVAEAGDRKEALASLRRFEPQVVIQDLGLPPDAEGTSEGFATLEEVISYQPLTKVIVVTGRGGREQALRAVAMGAYDFFEKPFDVDVLKMVIHRAMMLAELEQAHLSLLETAQHSSIEGLLTSDKDMLALCKLVEKVAPTRATLLIQGESGTGKELVARAAHTLSERTDGPFVPINCAAIPDNLLESELFGYEKGAFTGADKATPGKIESADGGTLFLDEIGDMPLALQAKLLRFSQERTVERLGGGALHQVDVRLVCATHQDLKKSTQENRFREDLYYRLSEVVVEIPALRSRKRDAIMLAKFFARAAAMEFQVSTKSFSKQAIDAIESYPWPGNVRELQNVVRRAVLTSENKTLSAQDLGLEAIEKETFNLRQVRAQAETSAIKDTLMKTDGNISRAAEMLGITRPTLYDLMSKYDIDASNASMTELDSLKDAS